MPADGPVGAARVARAVGVLVLAVAVVVGGLYWLGATHPPRSPGIATDRLGPDPGETVDDYRATSQRSLDAASGTRWALISLRAAVTDDVARTIVAGTTPARVALHVPIAGVATPVAVVPVTPDAGSFTTARTLAIGLLDGSAVNGTGFGGIVAQDGVRGEAVSGVVGSRLAAGCACVVGVVVRGAAARLREIAADRRVRAVEALPADATARFTVVPLLPEQTVGGAPVPDSGPVPAR
ncbi:hypothetical protein [Williamsia serinedens]|uniref:Flp pilus assembly protein CpaB n=1 Tax=Williamsia serinedens TaxID=391736 RepID=A0ABT1H6C2_9NOCA|nr:hypothetical protein [Williamsia serinedens]MCP2162504.1 hypothetical protein [Williamsia serinedens]